MNFEEQKKVLKKTCLHKLVPDSTNSFNFCGVDWRHALHPVPTKDDTPSLPSFDSKGMTFKTRRALASILGKILWHRHIHRIKYDNSASSKAIQELYSSITPEHTSGWDEPTEPISLATRDGLEAAWNLRFDPKQQWREAVPLQDEWSDDRVCWGAVDAASETALTASVFHNRRARTWSVPKPERHDYHDHTQIALAETLAIERFLIEALDNESNLIVLATDSQNVKNWI